jgi:hypothetical protein
MKKQKKQLLILLILLFVVGGGAFGGLKYMEYVEQVEAEKKAENTIYLTNLNPEDIESFTCWYFGEERRFEKRNGQWIAMNSVNTKLQQDWMNRMVSNLAQMTAVSKIENVKDLKQFGFEDGFKEYDIETANESYKFILGGFNDLSDTYYLYEASDPTVVYSYEPGFVTAFVSTVEALKETN